MIEFFAALSWQGAFAIVGSVVTIVLGIFGYMKSNAPPQLPNSVLPSRPSRDELDQLHSRISSAKDIAMENKGEIRALSNLVKAIDKQIDEHERRDIEDFNRINAKVDKIMDIVIQILQDDKL